MLCAAAAAYSDRRDAYLVAAGKYCLSKSMYRTCACAGTDSAAARSAVAARAADDVAQRGLLIAPVFVFVCVCVCVQHALLKSSLSADCSRRCGPTSLLPLTAHAVAYVFEYQHRQLSAKWAWRRHLPR